MSDRPRLGALQVLYALARAVSVRAIYPATHPRVAEALAAFEHAVTAVLAPGRDDKVVVAASEGEVIVGDRPVSSERLRLRAFLRGMQRLGVESLELAPGLTADEGRRLVEGLSGSAPLAASAHVVLGRLRLDPGADDGARRGALSEHDLERAATAFLALRNDPGPAVEQLDHLVWAFVDRLEETERSLLLVAPGADPDRMLFLHSLNVSLLTLAQARSLGIGGQAAHDLALAALLHDVGKLRLPPALGAQRGRLDRRQWQVARLHPELGAALLCDLPAAPEVAVQVAYEHHWRWDGKPSYPPSTAGAKPGLAAQLTAVADTYDAILAARGLDEGAGAGAVAFEVLLGRAGSWLDPALVANFLRTLGAGNKTADETV